MLYSNQGPEVADIFRQFGKHYLAQNKLPIEQHKAFAAIKACRTDALGKHSVKECDACHKEIISYNSCRNRHCPKCQFLRTEKWLFDRKKDLLPVNYFHGTFTIPHQLNPIFLMNKALLYDLLLKSVAFTLSSLAKDPKWLGADIGFILVLHTWTQKLLDHFHVHAIIPGGGLSFDRTHWVPSKYDKFLIPIQVLSSFFKGTFLNGLKDLIRDNKINYGRGINNAPQLLGIISKLLNDYWNVNIKQPFYGPSGVVNYLGRYTHRIAISNSRILKIKNDEVTFSYKDRADNNKTKIMSLAGQEFIRRFLFHVLPLKFIKIRHYGLLGTRNRHIKLAIAKNFLGVTSEKNSSVSAAELNCVDFILKKFNVDITLCPHCKKGLLVTKHVFGHQKNRPP